MVGTLAATVIIGTGTGPLFTSPGTLSAACLQISPVAPALAGNGTLTATMRAIYPNSTALTGDGALSAATPAQIYAPQPALAGNGALSAPFIPYLQAAGALGGDGALAGSGFPAYPATPGLAGAGGIAALLTQQFPFGAPLTGGGLLAANAYALVVGFADAGVGNWSSGSPFSWAHTIAGTALVVGLTNSSPTTPTVTVGGVNVPALTPTTYCGMFGVSVAENYVTLYGLLNPPTGAQTISVSGDAAMAGQSMSYYHAGSFGTAVSTGTNAGTPSMSVSSAAGEYVAQAFGTATSSPGSYNQTQRYNTGFAAYYHWGTIVGDAPGAASVTFSCTPSGEWGGVAVPLIPG